MHAFKHLMVPTDFSACADSALGVAIDLASKFDAKITLFHASWLPTAAYDAYCPEGGAWHLDSDARAARETLDAALERVTSRHQKTDSLVAYGEPFEAILQASMDLPADLIVMGTHGRRGLSRVFLGSVAEKIVRLSLIPVLTVCAEADRRAKRMSLEAAVHSGQR